MSLNFLPGEPNPSPESCCFVNWNTIQILTYTSGNNLVILTKNSTHLQTIYLPRDSFAVDVNKVNGKIAVALGNEVHIYTPDVTNYYNFNFHGRKNIDELKVEWVKEHVIVNENDKTDISSLSWSDYTELPDADLETQFMDLPPEFNCKSTCELITGSAKSLTLHQLTYVTEKGTKNVKCRLLWYKDQPNPIYKVKFSPNATCVASIGYYDKNVKLWHRVGFTAEFSDFELNYLHNDTYVTDIIWKNQMSEYDPNNQYSAANSKPGSVPLTPSHSFILKPANSIIKNDTTFLNESNSIYSSSKRERQHNVLYTITADSVLRVYSTFRLDKGFMIYDSGSLDLFDGNIEAKKAGVINNVTFIDNPYLELGLEKLINDIELEHGTLKVTNSTRKQSKIIEFINSKSELCMVVSSDGSLRLYALSNLCNSFPTKMTCTKLDKIQVKGETYLANLQLSKYCLPSVSTNFYLKSIQIDHYSEDMALSMIIHDKIRNTIREVGFTFKELLSVEKSQGTSNGKTYKRIDKKIGNLKQKFTGHQKSVRKLIRASDGSSILSVTRFNENYLWTPIYLTKKRTTLTKKSMVITPSPIIDAVIWNNGEYVFAIVDNFVLAYYCFTSKGSNNLAKEVGRIEFDTSCIPESFFLLPELDDLKCHIVSVCKDGLCKSFQFTIEGEGKYGFNFCPIENLPKDGKNDLHIIRPIDPVGWDKSIDRIGRDVLATVSSSGLVSIFYVTFDDKEDKTIKWHLKDSFGTGIKHSSFISCSSINKMAIVDEKCNTLSIWDMKVGVMDYSETFEGDVVKDIDWTSTLYEQGILSVGFASYALLFTQLRYDYTNRSASFAKIKKVDISTDTEHSIGDSIWMQDGLLVIGAGNQLYLSDKRLDINNDLVTNQAIGTLEIVSNDLMHLSSALNGPLPLYHPQFIIQLLLGGRSQLIGRILVNLTKILREIDLGERDENDFDLQLSSGDILADGIDKGKQQRFSSSIMDQFSIINDDGNDEFNEQCADILVEKLKKLRLPFLTGHQQITLSHTVTIMKDILIKYKKILDANGVKFFLTMKLYKVNFSKDTQTETLPTIRMRDVNFALHSDNRDILYNIVNEQSGMKMDWKYTKRYMLPYWLERHKLIQLMEIVAANEFLKFQDENNGRKDPSSCSIIYLALRKKKVLLGLWKTSIGHPEREKMVRFLNNDFSESRWKTAALKNAFVLLGKHRYLDAASFFLLADSPKDAVNVIMKQLDDMPLAIAVARCYDSKDGGDTLKSVLERKLLMEAITMNDRWKLSWIFWILGDKPHSAQALIKPLSEIQKDIISILPNFKWPNIEGIIRTSNTEDPVLLVMYDSLRNRNVEYNRGITGLDLSDEFSFLLKASTMYMKMGCDWLALYLVSNWKFSAKTVKKVETKEREKPGDILASFMPVKSDELGSKGNGNWNGNAARSILDDFSDPSWMVPTQTPTKKVTSKEPVKLTKPKPKAVPNMLDAWG